MPPARPRAVADDSRSETSSTVTNLKDRTNNAGGVSKSKKNASSFLNNSNSTLKAAAVNGALAAAGAGSVQDGTAEAEPDLRHTDWSSLPVSVLHNYRSAYKLQMPPSYTHSHADILYKSSDIAMRAPSVVLARKKLRDLKQYRKQQAQSQTNGYVNGTRKGSKSGKSSSKDKSSREESREGRRQQQDSANLKDKSNTEDSSIAQSIEPPSPTTASITTTTQPSLIPAATTATAAVPNDDASMTGSTFEQTINPIPLTLSQADPESTIVGRQSPTSLATSIRKHFNAQQLNEVETIARFTYVVRQQGAGLHQRHGSSTRPHAVGQPLGTAGAGAGNTGGSSATTRSSGLGGGHIHVEGADGDGDGWIMGRNGRQVRIGEGGGGGTFRLRFRP